MVNCKVSSIVSVRVSGREALRIGVRRRLRGLRSDTEVPWPGLCCPVFAFRVMIRVKAFRNRPLQLSICVQC